MATLTGWLAVVGRHIHEVVYGHNLFIHLHRTKVQTAD
jgi:hypothetical protein